MKTPGSGPTSTAAGVVDLAKSIDGGRWTGAQKIILLMVGCALVFDGFDNQALGLAAPAIIREWGVSKSVLAPVLALGHVGMMIGAALGGYAGDRLGRKAALVGSVAIFAVATLLMATASNVEMLGLLRIIAGVGMGGALPTAAAMVAEYTPARSRHFAVSATIVCVPLGGVAGGLIAAELLPAAGWRSLFALAGIATLAIAFILLIALPESARYLLARHGDTPKLRRILARVGVPIPPEATLIGDGAAAAFKAPLRAIVKREFRVDTFALWIAFGFSLLSVYASFGWLPTMLAEAGYSLVLSSTGLTAFNLGGVAAALLAAMVISRLGSRVPMTLMALGAMTTALTLIVFPPDPSRPAYVMILSLGLLGAFINGVQVGLYALAAHVYPLAVRSTGVGSAASVGRIGAICSAFVGAATLEAFGPTGFYGAVAIAMGLAGVTLLVVRRHSPRAPRTSAPSFP